MSSGAVRLVLTPDAVAARHGGQRAVVEAPDENVVLGREATHGGALTDPHCSRKQGARSAATPRCGTRQRGV